MALGTNLKKEKLITTGPNKPFIHSLTETTETMETELQKEALKIKGNGNGLTSEQLVDMKGQLDAINAAFAFIEFDVQGNILNANDI